LLIPERAIIDLEKAEKEPTEESLLLDENTRNPVWVIPHKTQSN